MLRDARSIEAIEAQWQHSAQARNWNIDGLKLERFREAFPEGSWLKMEDRSILGSLDQAKPITPQRSWPVPPAPWD
jgi:hypothetical protein